MQEEEFEGGKVREKWKNLMRDSGKLRKTRAQ